MSTTANGATTVGHTGRQLPHILVIHVKQGCEARERHVERMLGGMGLAFEFILDGDKAELTPDVLRRYFRDDRPEVCPATPYGSMLRPMVAVRGDVSCTLKHILAYKAIVERGWDGALIMEDDIMLGSRFQAVLARSLAELRGTGSRPALISYEDSLFRFVPRSRRRHGQTIYRAHRDRCTGCYYVNRAAAEAMYRHATDTHFHLPIDLMHTFLENLGLLDYYWTHPTVASQGSHTGIFPTETGPAKGFLYPLRHRVQRMYKRLISWFA